MSNSMRSLVSSLILFILLTANVAWAISPKEQLVGMWKFKQGRGGPCANLIIELEYSFHPNGKYSSRTKMRSVLSSLAFEGTYSATDSTVTVFVDGHTVGPTRYRIVEDVLIVTQPEYNCEVELVREDYL